jgi:hypothetical protein
LRQSGHSTTDANIAVEQGWLAREKVEGIWIYGTTDDGIALAEGAIKQLTEETLNAWLLGPLHPLTGFVAKHLSVPSASKDAVLQFVRRQLRKDALHAVAALTNKYDPYLAAFLPDDDEEVAAQVAFLVDNLESRRLLSPEDLPSPQRRRTLRTWRGTILRHGEYLGLGHMAAGALLAWP